MSQQFPLSVNNTKKNDPKQTRTRTAFGHLISFNDDWKKIVLKKNSLRRRH
jgi:hypothetical protein